MLAFFLEDNKIPYLLLCLGVISCERLFREIGVLLLLLIKKTKTQNVSNNTDKKSGHFYCMLSHRQGWSHTLHKVNKNIYMKPQNNLYICNVFLMCTHRRNGGGGGGRGCQPHKITWGVVWGGV